MNGDKYLVRTEAGEFTVNFGEEDGDRTTYEGDEGAIKYFKNRLLFNFVSGEDGHSINPDFVSPYDFWAYCQTDTIRIIPDEYYEATFKEWESELSEGYEMKQNFDSVDDSQAFALMGEGAQILGRLDENSATFFADLGRLKEIIAALGESTPDNGGGENSSYRYDIDGSDGYMLTFSSPDSISGLKVWSSDKDEAIKKAEQAIEIHKNSPYLSRRWNSPFGRVISVKLDSLPTMGEGTESYGVEYSDGSYRLIQAKNFENTVREQEFDASSEGMKAAEERKLQYEERQRELSRKMQEESAKNDEMDAKIKLFTDAYGYSDMAAGKARSLLKGIVNFSGIGVITRLEFIELAVNGGSRVVAEEEDRIKELTRTRFNRMNQAEQDAHAKKKREAGTKTVYSLKGYEITKTEADYANFIAGDSGKEYTAEDAYDPADYEEEPVAEAADETAEVERIINSHGFKSFTKNAAESLAVIFGIDNGTEKGYDRSLFVSSIAGRFKTMARNEGDLFVKLALAWLSVANEANGKPAITARNSVWSLADGFDSYRKYFQKQESAVTAEEPVHTAEDAYKAGYEAYPPTDEKPTPKWVFSDSKLMDEYRRGMSQAKTDKFVNEVNSMQAGLDAVRAISPFLSGMQRKVMQSAMRGEEGQYFIDKAIEVKEIIDTMPKTYGQNGKGGEAIAYLHYFTGSMDWYITEKDMEGEGTLQAFGLADIFNDGGEVGYISIAEIVGRGVDAELDLHWTPKTLNQIRGVDDELESQAANKEASEKEEKIQVIEKAKKIVERVVSELSGNMMAAWDDKFSDEFLSPWSYGPAKFEGIDPIRIGVSGGGVMSIDGHPFYRVNGKDIPIETAEVLREALSSIIEKSKPAMQSPLDKFEEDGGEPWQVTKAKWVWIMMGHFETLGQGIDVTEVEDFHKSKVKEALDAGKPVPAEVMADYPDMKAETEEEKQARYSRAEERLNNLVARAAGEVSPEFEADKAWLETVVSGQADMMDAEFSDKLISMIEKYEQGDPTMFTLANKALDKYTEFAMNL